MKSETKTTNKNPDHSNQLAAINRVIGQLESIKKMIIDKRYCPEIIHQLRAARGGLVSAEVMILSVHIENCLRDAIESSDDFVIKEKSKELTKYVKGLIM